MIKRFTKMTLDSLFKTTKHPRDSRLDCSLLVFKSLQKVFKKVFSRNGLLITMSLRHVEHKVLSVGCEINARNFFLLESSCSLVCSSIVMLFADTQFLCYLFNAPHVTTFGLCSRMMVRTYG